LFGTQPLLAKNLCIIWTSTTSS